MRQLLFTLALVLGAAPAFAQTEQPSERFLAAQAMIERAQLGDVFEPLEDEDVIMVRHLASGMVCLFERTNRRAEVVIFDTPVVRGDDAACIRDTPEQLTTVYATRYPEPKSAEQALAEAVAGLRHRYNDAQPTPALLNMTSDAMPPLLAAHFLIVVNGERWITSAIVARQGDWVFKVRYTAPAADDDALMRHQLEANVMLSYALMRASNRE